MYFISCILACRSISEMEWFYVIFEIKFEIIIRWKTKLTSDLVRIIFGFEWVKNVYICTDWGPLCVSTTLEVNTGSIICTSSHFTGSYRECYASLWFLQQLNNTLKQCWSEHSVLQEMFKSNTINVSKEKKTTTKVRRITATSTKEYTL